jgi:hypothetical protein
MTALALWCAADSIGGRRRTVQSVALYDATRQKGPRFADPVSWSRIFGLVVVAEAETEHAANHITGPIVVLRANIRAGCSRYYLHIELGLGRVIPVRPDIE